jgi:hypothetical protein
VADKVKLHALELVRRWSVRSEGDETKGRFEITTKVLREPWRRPLVDLVGRLSAGVAMVGAWSLALKLGLEGPWLVFAPLAPLAIVALAVRWLLEEFWTVSLTVGADGIFVAQRRRSKEFFFYAEIERIAHDTNSVTLHMRKNLPPLVLSIRSAKGHDAVKELVRRLEEGRASFLQSLPLCLEVLARGERSARQWLRDMRDLTKRHDYREAAVTSEHLWPVLENAAVDSPARAAAAVALRDHLDEEGRARLRVAAEACASPNVRVALEAVLGEDEEELTRALECL